MIVQMVGACLLLIAAAAVVIRLRIDEKRYIQSLQCAVRIIRHAKRKISLFGTPTEDILCDFDDSGCAKYLCVRKDVGFHAGVAPVSAALHKQEQALFDHFAERLGQGYKEDALKLCDFTLSCLEEKTAKAEIEYPSRMKLYTALPILFAVSLFVLFL